MATLVNISIMPSDSSDASRPPFVLELLVEAPTWLAPRFENSVRRSATAQMTTCQPHTYDSTSDDASLRRGGVGARVWRGGGVWGGVLLHGAEGREDS